MATISIIRQHNLDKEAARGEIQKLADRLAREFSAECQWQGDKLEFKRNGADGSIVLVEGQLILEIRLGFLLSPMKSNIESTIQGYLDRHLS